MWAVVFAEKKEEEKIKKMKNKQIIGLFLVVAIITGIVVGLVVNASSTGAESNDVDNTRYLLDDCRIRVVGDFRSVDVFNQFESVSAMNSVYYGVILKHCVYVAEANVDKIFTAEKGRYDTGYMFIFQFVSELGFTSSETFFASSGNSYYLKYYVYNGATAANVITITLHMA
jgi:hypothetical protein